MLHDLHQQLQSYQHPQLQKSSHLHQQSQLCQLHQLHPAALSAVLIPSTCQTGPAVSASLAKPAQASVSIIACWHVSAEQPAGLHQPDIRLPAHCTACLRVSATLGTASTAAHQLRASQPEADSKTPQASVSEAAILHLHCVSWCKPAATHACRCQLYGWGRVLDCSAMRCMCQVCAWYRKPGAAAALLDFDLQKCLPQCILNTCRFVSRDEWVADEKALLQSQYPLSMLTGVQGSVRKCKDQRRCLVLQKEKPAHG